MPDKNTDKIEKIGNCIVQHGPYNDRVYLMDFDFSGLETVCFELDKLAVKNKYSKIFAKIPATAVKIFLENSYVIEALLPNMFIYDDKKEDGFFVSKYFSSDRRSISRDSILSISDIYYNSLYRTSEKPDLSEQKKFEIRKISESEINTLCSLYRVVFAQYPFPIHEPEYIKKTMSDNIVYFGCWDGDILASASSSEISLINKNAEMTDFATNPKYKGNNLAYLLLDKMEQVMSNEYKIQLSYTIARAISPGINYTFAKKSYIYAGTLINNTRISTGFESMNVWYKLIS